MAQLLVGLLGITLEEAGKAIGLAAISAGTTKVFNLIVGGASSKNPDSGNKKELADLLAKFKSLRTDITTVVTQIEDLRLNVKKDLIQPYVDEINALHDQYWGAIDAMAEIAYEEPSSRKNEKYEHARRRCNELGKRVTNEIYVNIEHIHTFIAGQGSESLLALVHTQGIRDCDFYTYFCRTKTQLLNYWAIETKALTLLQCVKDDPDVDFTDGPRVIERVHEKIKAQEKFFDELVPKSIAQLATAFAKDKSGMAKLGITFQSQADKYIMGSSLNREECRIDGAEVTPWLMEPVKSLANPGLKEDYYFRLRSGDAGYLTFTNTIWDVSTFGPPFFAYWKVRPSLEGKFRLEFMSQFNPPEYNHHYLCAKTQRDIHYLGRAEELNPSDAGQLFIIALT